MRRIILGLIFAVFTASCQTAPKTPFLGDSQVAEPNHGMETIVIVGTNDIHGTLAPLELKTKEKAGVEPVEYNAGGAALLASYLKKIRSEFGSRMVWFDAGDEFQGSVESNSLFGQPMVTFFNSTRLTAAAIGNHEFDFGVDVLKKRMTEAQYPYLNGNIRTRDGETLAEFPNTLPHLLVTAGKLRVGIIGLSTLETPVTTQPKNVKDYSFEDLKLATLREAAALRKKGARIVVITAHAGLKCELGRVSPGHMMRKPNDLQGACSDSDEIVRLLHSLPSGTVDAVVTGHTHQIVHHWVSGVPVIQSGAMGRFLSAVYLTYDWEQGKVLPDETRIEGPIPVCERVFKNQNDCSGERPAPKNGRGPLVPAKFHGEVMKPDSDALQLIAPALASAEPIRQRQLSVAARRVDHTPSTESELGNLVADAIRTASGADVSMVNPGAIRAPLEQGPITYGTVFRTFPFDNRIATLKVSGRELSTILRVATNGSRGFPSVSGIKLRMISPTLPAPFIDMNGNGKFELWEVDRLLEARLPNGSMLEPSQNYLFASLDFVVSGGDDMAWVMSQIPKDRITFDIGIMARDAIVKYLEKIKILNPANSPLVDPAKPRLVFDLVDRIKKKIRSHRHRKQKKPHTAAVETYKPYS